MAFSLGNFAGGIGAGIEQGQDIQAKRRALALQALQQASRGDVDKWLQSQSANPIGGQNNPLTMGTTPPPMGATPGMPLPGPGPTSPAGVGQGAAGMAAMTQAQNPGLTTGAPAAQGGGAPGGPTSGGAQPPQASAPPAPSTGAGPITANAGGALGAAPSVQPGGPQQPPDFMKVAADPKIQADAKSQLQQLAQQINTANPGKKWKPGELLEAVQTAIDAEDKLNPMTKALLTAQVGFYKATTEAQTKQAATDEKAQADAAQTAEKYAALQQKSEADQARIKELEDSLAAAQLRTETQGRFNVRRAGVTAGGQVAAADVRGKHAENVARTNQDGQNQRAPAKNKTAEAVANTNAEARVRVAEIGNAPVGAVAKEKAQATVAAARDAISKGAPRAAVIKRLRDAGITANP